MKAVSASLLRYSLVCFLLLTVIISPFLLFGGFFDALAVELVGGDLVLVGSGGFALLAADIALPVPSSVVATIMGAALGGWLGTLVNVMGLTAGCLIGFLGGRSGAGLMCRVLGESEFAEFSAWVGRHCLVAILLCRAVPVLAEASLIIAGAGRARLPAVIATAAFGNLCIGALYAFAGAASGPEAVPALPAFAAALGLPMFSGLAAMLWSRRRA